MRSALRDRFLREEREDEYGGEDREDYQDGLCQGRHLGLSAARRIHRLPQGLAPVLGGDRRAYLPTWVDVLGSPSGLCGRLANLDILEDEALTDRVAELEPQLERIAGGVESHRR